ncbi:hypothetical protein [Microbacterium sp. Mcb102]|uniref:hypothetical protein n=1 Tax=Microbacterium sp. Mcb102 TaxID=2926012 RepID=UPI0021C6D8CB|nr:hypothetical protein [Microbacterium sp. Mcb102]
MDEQRTSTGITRRSVVRAAAWSAPVIAAAIATPLAAASGAAALTVQPSPATVTGADFAWPGATVTNTGTTPLTVTWSVDVAPVLESLSGPLTGTVTIPPGSSELVAAGITGYYVAAAWATTLTLTLLGDGAPRTSTVTFQAEEQ